MADGPRVEGYDHLRDVDGWLSALEAPFTTMVGLTWDLLSPDRVEARVPVTTELHQPYGLVHGGVYATIVETLGSVAGALRVLGDGEVVVGVHNSTDFLRSVRSGTIHAACTPVHVGRSQHLWLTECRDDDGRPVARGQLRVHVLDASRVA